jgi:hypothetical protein
MIEELVKKKKKERLLFEAGKVRKNMKATVMGFPGSAKEKILLPSTNRVLFY